MSKKVCITGVGVNCAIGNNSDECFSALKTGSHGISKLTSLDSIFKDKILVGELKLSTEALLHLANLQNIKSHSRGALMAILAVKEALKTAQLSAKELSRTALISGTSVGGMELFEQGYPFLLAQNIQEPKKFFSEHDCGNINSKIATEFGIKAYLSTISTACSSSANAILLGARLIKSGIVDRAIVGGSDALSKFTINGFNTLGILDEEHTKPFDNERRGLNLGEGAAYLVLEAEEVCRDKNILGVVAGYGNANDAFHQTASSAEGTGSKFAIKKAFHAAGIESHEIDYINTHGTGTPNNDLSESNAMIELFGKDKIPPFNSLKPYTGHTLAACGSIEAIFSLYSINSGVLFPTLNFKNSIEETGLIPIHSLMENQEINTVLSNSFGFGGNCTSLIFSKY